MSSTGKRLWVALKALAALAIAAGVGAQFWRVLTGPELAGQTFPFRWPYLLASGGLYLSAHTVWGLYWWRLLVNQGVDLSPVGAVRAYFVSQFGKYVPGKVWVLLLRVGLLHGTGASRSVVAVTALYETLTNMAAGAMLAAALVPLTGVGREYVSGRVLVLVGIAVLPIGVWVFLKAVGRATRAARGPGVRPLPNPPVGLLLAGLLQASIGWCLLGISLLAAVRAVHPDPPEPSVGEFVRMLAAVSAAYVVGFIVLVSPGGLGPREFLLTEFLAAGFADRLGPATAEATAVVTALVLRLVWTTFEVGLAGGWYWLGRPGPRPRGVATTGKGTDDHAE